MYWVHVIESRCSRFSAVGRSGPFHVGFSTDPSIALMRMNGEMPGGTSFFVTLRPWRPRALYGPFETSSEATAVLNEIKKLKREQRATWNEEGRQHPWVFNPRLRPQQF